MVPAPTPHPQKKWNAFIFKGQRVQKTFISNGQSVFLCISIPNMKILRFFETSQTTVEIVESHFQLRVPRITLRVTHSYTLYNVSDTPEFTISLNVQVMYVLSPNAMTVILIEVQAPFKSIYCCPSDRNVSHQLRSICSCIKHTHTQKRIRKKKVLHGILYILTLKQPWKIPHTTLIWGQASIIASIPFQRRSWSKIMVGIYLKIIIVMALVMIW